MIGMDYYQGGGASHSQGSPFVGYEQHEEWRQQEQEQGGLPVSSSANTSGLEEAMWGLSLQSSPDQGMEMAAGPYPERPGEQDCVYYMRTGLCAFGMSCKFNHPPNRKLAAAIARGKGEYPERPGQPECQYFLKTGTCKFGATCKYDHPREKAAIQSRVQLNIIGLPYRPGEKDCAYYMRTGACKYGVTCKFHHPQPAVVPSSALFPGASQNSPVANQQQQHTHSSQQHYQSAWPVRPFPSPRLQAGASSYTPLLLPSPASVVSIPGWSTYHEGHHQPQALYLPGSPGAGTAELGSFSPYLPGSPTMGLPATLSQQHKEYSFPERPGEPECQYYLKTGDCKFGSNCRFHHPRDRVASTGATLLSPMGLPLRSGVQPCNYYVRFGICKFGPTCKFDHPLAAIYGFGPTLNYTNLPSTTKSTATISLVELHENGSNSSTSTTSAVPSGGALDSSSRKEDIPTG